VVPAFIAPMMKKSGQGPCIVLLACCVEKCPRRIDPPGPRVVASEGRRAPDGRRRIWVIRLARERDALAQLCSLPVLFAGLV